MIFILSADSRKNEYLIYENPMKALLLFALPMIFGNLFQQIYNIADSVIVGRFVSQNALAAVGASSALTNVFICVAVGAGTGASVLVSQLFGRRDYKRMKCAVSTSILFFLVLSILLGIIGFIFSRPIMQILHTPDEVMDMATVYLRVYFAGFPFLFMYNILASMFNAIGNSRTPLYFLIFSSALNVGLDLYMVVSLGMGVFGAALATLIAQGISTAFSFFVFLRTMRQYPSVSQIFSWPVLRKILAFAVPSIIQQSTVSIGMMLVQSVVNIFGPDALIENLIAVIWVSIGNAVSPFTAQNYGARRNDRIPQGYHAALLLDLIFAAAVFLLVVPPAHRIAALFLGDSGTTEAYTVAVSYMRWIGVFCFFLGAKMATDGVLKGIGSMKIFMIANLCNLAIRVSVAMILAPRFGISFVWYPVPVGWITNILISHSAYRKFARENDR